LNTQNLSEHKCHFAKPLHSLYDLPFVVYVSQEPDFSLLADPWLFLFLLSKIFSIRSL